MGRKQKYTALGRKKKDDSEESDDDWVDDDGVKVHEEGKFPDGAEIIRPDIMRAKYPLDDDIKLVMVVRADLKMGKGKIGA